MWIPQTSSQNRDVIQENRFAELDFDEFEDYYEDEE